MDQASPRQSTVSTPRTGPWRTGPWRAGLARTGIEFLVCLSLTVTLIRTFALEGYVIETGSMAPNLLGHHRRAVCHDCRFPFAVEAQATERATCPNCGSTGIAADEFPANEGDHLLVARCAYEIRQPRRWEVAVFRNPARPSQAFVKRLVGLPGEQLQLIDGDVWIDGHLQMKSLSVQRGMRILVHDYDYRPNNDDPNWQPRWVAEAPWENVEGAFRTSAAVSEPIPESANADPTAPEPAATKWAWVQYRHWVRRGGRHATSVHLAQWPSNLPDPRRDRDGLRYDAARQQLVCHGAMPADTRDRLLLNADTTEFRAAIEQLYRGSHIAPITDEYGYNRRSAENDGHEVRDLMLALRVRQVSGAGQFAIRLCDGSDELECRFDIGRHLVTLHNVRTGDRLRSVELAKAGLSSASRLEISFMDRQLLAAINGKLIFEPWMATGERTRATAWNPVRFGARGLQLTVDELRLYRDVYYTGIEGARGVRRPVTLQSDEYFALGDNSPISRDSRTWPPGKVLLSRMILGRALFVHLPSRNCSFELGSWRRSIRIPEISRVRYIR